MTMKEAIENLQANMNDISVDVAYDNWEYDAYICDAVSEEADKNTSIYYSDIFDFMKEHLDYVERAIDEFGWGGCGSDLYKAGQMGEFMYNEEQIYESESDMHMLCALYSLRDEYEVEAIDEDLLETLESKIYRGYFDRFSDIRDEVFDWMDDFLAECEEDPEKAKLIQKKAA